MGKAEGIAEGEAKTARCMLANLPSAHFDVVKVGMGAKPDDIDDVAVLTALATAILKVEAMVHKALEGRQANN